MNISRTISKLTASNILSKALFFAGITLFSQQIGASGMGTFFLFQANLVLLSILSDLGLRGAIEKRLSEGEAQGATLSTGLALKLLLIVCLGSVIVLFADIFNLIVGANIALILLVGFAVREFDFLSRTVLRSELRVGETAVLSVVHRTVWFVLGLAFIYYGFGAAGLIYSWILGHASSLLIGAARAETPLGVPTREQVGSLLSYSKYAFLTSVGSQIHNWADVLILGILTTNAMVGVYEVAWRVSSVTIILSNMAAATIFPVISSADIQSERDRISQLVTRSISLGLIPVVPAFFGSLIFAEEVLTVLFGQEFGAGWIVLIILMLERIQQSIHIVINRGVHAIDRADLAFHATVFPVLLNIGLNLILIPEFGIVGAAMATLCAHGASTILYHVYFSRYIPFSFPWRESVGLTIAAAVMAVLLFVLSRFIQANSMGSLVFVVSLGVVIYLLGVWIVPSTKEFVQDFINEGIRQKLSN